MKQQLQLNESNFIKGRILDEEKKRTVIECPVEGLDYCLYKRSVNPDLCPWNYKYLTLMVEQLGEDSLCLQLSFYTKEKTQEEADIRMIFGVLPHTKIMIPFDLSILDSQTLFPQRTKGRLKMTVFGKPVRLEEVEEIHLQTSKHTDVNYISVEEIAFDNSFQEWTSQGTLIDELGQWDCKDWKGKMKSTKECNAFLISLYEKAKEAEEYQDSETDEYGGCKKIQFTETGWFHIEEINGRYWLADPKGNAFFSMGIDCIRPGVETRTDPVDMWMGSFVTAMKQNPQYAECFETTRLMPGAEFFNFGTANMIRAFGADKWKHAWNKIVIYYLKKWKMNTIGNWSENDFIKQAAMPYVLPLDREAKRGFPTTGHKIFRDFPDVFSVDFSDASYEYAKALIPFKDDRYMIGYFMRNEPAWAFVYDLILAEEMLAQKERSVSKKVFISFMQDKYKDIDSLNRSWTTSFAGFDSLYEPIVRAALLSKEAKDDLIRFSEIMIERYVGIPAEAARAVDKNHLNLGMRYAYITDDSLLSGAKHFDVFSINSYQETPLEAVDYAGDHLHMPVIVGEFHHGALDRGLTAHGIRGVKTQLDRGKAYRYYVEQSLKSRYFLGSHYFQLNDQSCLGRFDGENYQIGFLDVCLQEYEEMCEQVRICHENMYEIALKNIEPVMEKGEDVPPIHY